MKLKCNMSDLMGKSKMSIQDVCNRTGLARNTVAKLYHETASRVDYETIVKLCTLFDVSVGDLFEIINE